METGMSQQEQFRVEILKLRRAGRMSQAEAAQRLRLTTRQVRRLEAKLARHGAKGLRSSRRGCPSHRRLAAATADHAIALVRAHYRDFGPTLAAEYLAEHHGVVMSKETLRQLMIRAKLWRPQRGARAAVHAARERRARFGELIQIDGSPHDWFEGRARRCTLIVFIDDATGRLTGLRFVPAESTRAYLETLRDHVLAHGCPLAFYSDRHGIFRVNAKNAQGGDGKTEFGRVAERLGIEPIHALTPQAKGRVERANQTLQDRLVKEMRLLGISSIEAGNGFLPTFMAWWDGKFAVAPRDLASAHRAWTATAEALEDALARHEERVLSKALTFSAGGRKYCVRTEGPGTALRGAKVVLQHFVGGGMAVRYKGRVLTVTAYGRYPVPDPAEDEKTIDARLDAILAARSVAAATQPRP